MISRYALAMCTTALFPCLAAADDLRVVTDIPPVNILVSELLSGISQPRVLVKGDVDPHHSVLKPSEIRALGTADVVVWIGHDLTEWLAQAISSAGKDDVAISLLDDKETLVHPLREAGTPEQHDAHDDHEDHADHDNHEDHTDHDDHEGHADHGNAKDAHAWMSAANLLVWTHALKAELSAKYPARADKIAANAEKLEAAIQAAQQAAKDQISTNGSKALFFYHDAFQYVTTEFDLPFVGSFLGGGHDHISPDNLRNARDELESGHVDCFVYGPEADAKAIDTLLDGLDVPRVFVDPMGPKGATSTGELLNYYAAKLTQCR